MRDTRLYSEKNGNGTQRLFTSIGHRNSGSKDWLKRLNNGIPIDLRGFTLFITTDNAGLVKLSEVCVFMPSSFLEKATVSLSGP